MDISQQTVEVERYYPSLYYSPERNEFLGELFITESDSYQIRIELTEYPNYFPDLYETEGRIPNKPDRHIYTNTGACCLTTRAKAQILLKTKIKTLKDLVKEVVIPYLQNNSYYELNKKYQTDEYTHHHQGIVDSYKDILKIDNETAIANVLYNRLFSPKLKIHNLCYCGSALKLKNCTSSKHDQAYRDFKLIDKELLAHDLDQSFLPLLKQKGIFK